MTNPESFTNMKLLDRVLALSSLVGLAEMAYIEADKHLNVLTWNHGAITLFNCSEQEAISKKLDMLVPIDKKKLLECPNSEKITKSIIDDNGYKLWYDFLITPIISIKGEKLGVSILVKDISKEIQKNSDLGEYRKQLQEIYEFAPIGIYKADMEGKFTLANSQFAWMLGYDSIELLIKKSSKNFYNMFADKKKAEKFKYYLKETELVNRFRCQLLKKNGSSLWTLSYAKLVYDKKSKVTGFNGFAIDISETIHAENSLKNANEKLTLLAVQDGLTKIPNRRKFDEFLANEWARHKRDRNELSVIMCDIDFFKFYNDTYGHQEGDNCLVQVAKAIKNSIFRPADLAARYGGEEFSVVLPQTDSNGALKVAENLNKCVEHLKLPHKSSKAADYVTLSVGASSTIPDSNVSFEDLLLRADEALYEAKKTGRNKAVYKSF
ncbi:MAG: diguanylate cyclase [Desulfobacteraceae bacterium]|nr:diguanylate cyclase [Desulfobacteraceae bacterium]